MVRKALRPKVEPGEQSQSALPEVPSRSQMTSIRSRVLRAGVLAIALPALAWIALLQGAERATAAPLRLASGDGFKPYADSSLPNGGLIADVVREVYKLLGEKIEIHYRPWRRGYQETLHGEYLGTFPYIPTASRKTKFLFSDPVYTLLHRPIVTTDTSWTAEEPDDLTGRTYCFPLGLALTGPVAAMTASGSLHREKPVSMSRCLEMLARGRVDFVLASIAQARATALESPVNPTSLKSLDVVLQRTTLHVIFPRGQHDSDKALERFNAGLEKLRASGGYDAVVARHME